MPDPNGGRPTPRAGATVRLANLSRFYGDVTAVQNVNLSIAAGEFITLLGPSGSGKTTALMMVAGFVYPSAGEIYIDEVPVARLPPQKRDLGMVFQNYALFPHMTVAENIAFPLRVRRVAKDEVRRRVGRVLEIVQLPGFEGRQPRQLSGGQQQRVAMARALVFEPRVLLMDEPLGALDKKLREHLQLELKHIHRRLNVTFVYVTHDQEEALTMSDRIAVMNHGRIEQVGAPTDLYEEPSSVFVADFIGESNLLNGVVRHAEPGALADIEIPGGQRFRAPQRRPVRAGEAVVASVRPERLALANGAAPTPGENRWSGRLVETIYVGDATKYRVAVGDQTLTLKAQNQAASAPAAIGGEVDIVWQPAHTKLLQDAPPEGGQAHGGIGELDGGPDPKR